MATRLRSATFNLENLDKPSSRREPTLQRRAELMRPQLIRLEADCCAYGRSTARRRAGSAGSRRSMSSWRGMPCSGYHRVATSLESDGRLYSERNLVVVSRFEILDLGQYKHDYAPPPACQLVTADPPQTEPREVAGRGRSSTPGSGRPTAEPSTSSTCT
jgi:hypothetical protein